MPKRLIAAIALAGTVLIVVGIALVNIPAALVVAGVLMLVFAWLALDALGATT